MIKDNKLLLNLSSYLFFGFLLCLFGISNVFAASYTGFDYTAQLYDNINGNLTAVTTGGPIAGNGLYEGYIAYAANSSGGAWGISSPITLLANHTYTLTASIPNECGYLTLSTHNRIGVGNSLANAKTSYENNTYVNEVYSKVIGGSNFLIQFAFTPTINGSYIVFPYATTTSCGSTRTYLESISIQDLGVDGVTQDEINNSLNNQTNIINNSITNMGDEIKDSINDNFNSCRPSYNILQLIPSTQGVTTVTDTNVIINGTVNTAYVVRVGDVNLKAHTTYTFESFVVGNKLGSYFLINQYGDTIYLSEPSSQFIVTTSNSYEFYLIVTAGTYSSVNFKPMISEGDLARGKYEKFGDEICQNKIDDTNDKLDQTNDKLNDLNNNITNDNIDNSSVSGAFSQFENFVDENATISSLITLPVTLFSAILNGMQSTCSPFNLGSLYGENLILPCVNLASYLGNTLWTMIDIIISGFAVYFISQKFIKVFNTFSSMKEGDVIDD